ncbi:MAG: hypothetical protein WC011_03640 [Candidatus Paceibacterota bacterium]
MGKEIVSKKVDDKKPSKIKKRGPRRGQSFNEKGQVDCPANRNSRVTTQMSGYCIKN